MEIQEKETLFKNRKVVEEMEKKPEEMLETLKKMLTNARIGNGESIKGIRLAEENQAKVFVGRRNESPSNEEEFEDGFMCIEEFIEFLELKIQKERVQEARNLKEKSKMEDVIKEMEEEFKKAMEMLRETIEREIVDQKPVCAFLEGLQKEETSRELDFLEKMEEFLRSLALEKPNCFQKVAKNIEEIQKTAENATKTIMDLSDITGDASNESLLQLVVQRGEKCLPFFKEVVSHYTKNPKLSLLYQGSRDGFESSAFHEKCDYKGANLVIVRNNFNRVFGGFTSKSWSSFEDGHYFADDFAVLFSLDLKQVFQQFPDKKDKAIFMTTYKGPIFGTGDLAIYSGCNENEESYCNINTTFSSKGFSDSDITGNPESSEFSVQDYAVYSVAKSNE